MKAFEMRLRLVAVMAVSRCAASVTGAIERKGRKMREATLEGFMKLGLTRFARVAAIAVLVVAAGSTAARAQCPASPNYIPDFTSNQNCLTLNGNASIPLTPGGVVITSWSGSGGTVTFNTAGNTFLVGQLITLSGFTTTTAFNDVTAAVQSAGSTFTINSAISGGVSETGVATPSAAITSWSASGGVVTFQASNSLIAGEAITLSGFPTTKAFNGLTFLVLSAGLSGSQFEVASSVTGGIAEAGVATPTVVLQLTSALTDQVGSAWFNNPQPVAGTFSTTFTFQLSGGNTNLSPADGIAFVIQNSALTALGPDGCGMGFGGDVSGSCTSGTGISNSLAVEFNTFNNGGIVDSSGNSVAIQSCGTAPNNVDTVPSAMTTCNLAVINLPGSLADGNIHRATITYAASTLATCPPPSGASNCSSLDVILDNTDLFPGGILVNLSALLNLANGNAWVGFTGATGGGDDNQDILSWTFTPNAQSTATTTGVTGTINIQGGPANNGSDFTALLQPPNANAVSSSAVSIKRFVMTQQQCNQLVQKSFPFTQCLVTQNAGLINGVLSDGAVLTAVTCNDQPGQLCGEDTGFNWFATLGDDFNFLYSDNPGLKALVSTVGPYLGGLKGSGPDPLNPCTPFPNNSPALFSSNQITQGFLAPPDGGGGTKRSSGGGGSCWVDTYFTFGELPPGIKVNAPAQLTTYKQNANPGTAVYTCSNSATSKLSSSATGPYLTVATCTQKQTPNLNNGSTCSSPPPLGNPGPTTPISCTGQFDLSTKGLHTFTVTATDSSGDVNINIILYNVK